MAAPIYVPNKQFEDWLEKRIDAAVAAAKSENTDTTTEELFQNLFAHSEETVEVDYAGGEWCVSVTVGFGVDAQIHDAYGQTLVGALKAALFSVQETADDEE